MRTYVYAVRSKFKVHVMSWPTGDGQYYIHTIKRHKQHKTGNENDKSEGRERFGNGKNVWVAPFNSSDNTFNIYIGVMLRAHMFQVGE